MDDLIKRLRDGVIEHDKRWSGDTHDDLGGSTNYEATEAVMTEAAAALAEAQAEVVRLREALGEIAGECGCSIARAALQAHPISDVERVAQGEVE